MLVGSGWVRGVGGGGDERCWWGGEMRGVGGEWGGERCWWGGR